MEERVKRRREGRQRETQGEARRMDIETRVQKERLPHTGGR